MSITDPMHTFLLGMAHNEIKLCLSSLPKDKKLQFQDRFKHVKVPYDVGRIPTGIKDEDDLPGMTAQQWKNFLCIYARPCFAELLPVSQYQCLCLLCEIVEPVSVSLLAL